MRDESALLLEAVAAMARTVRSLYGPNKHRKQVTDESGQSFFTADAYVVASTLQSQSAATAILQQALDEQQREFGTGCTTMLSLTGVLAEAILELQRQGLPNDAIQQALHFIEDCCLQTARNMRVLLAELIPSFGNLEWSRQLAALGRLLSTGGEKDFAALLAVQVGSTIEPLRFRGGNDVNIEALVAFHVVRGGVTCQSSSRVYDGVLLPICETDHRNSLRSRLPCTSNDTITLEGGVAILAGDLNTCDFLLNSSVHAIFVHGEIGSQVMDAVASIDCAAICIPVSSYNSLRQLAAMSGAEVVDSLEELLPSAIGSKRLRVKTLDLSVSKIDGGDSDHDDNELATFFLQITLADSSYQPCASVLIRGPTNSLAVELRNQIRKMICRLRNSLHSGYVLPGNGGFWCACAAAVAHGAETQDTAGSELLSFATARLVDPLNRLGAILLENTGGDGIHNSADSDTFFSRLAKVRAVQQRFTGGVRDVGATKFYSRYYDFRNTGYDVLPPDRVENEPEDEDGRQIHVDEFASMNSTIRLTFRALQVLLNVDSYHIN